MCPIYGVAYELMEDLVKKTKIVAERAKRIEESLEKRVEKLKSNSTPPGQAWSLPYDIPCTIA